MPVFLCGNCQGKLKTPPDSFSVVSCPRCQYKSTKEQVDIRIEEYRTGGWSCFICTSINNQTSNACTVCGAVPFRRSNAPARSKQPQPRQQQQRYLSPSKPSVLPIGRPVKSPVQQQQQQQHQRQQLQQQQRQPKLKLAPGQGVFGVQCSVCTYKQPVAVVAGMTCQMCSSQLLNSAIEQALLHPTAQQPQPQVVKKKPPASWDCKECTFLNREGNAAECAVCKSPRDPGKVPSEAAEASNQGEAKSAARTSPGKKLPKDQVLASIECNLVTALCLYVGTLTITSTKVLFHGTLMDAQSVDDGVMMDTNAEPTKDLSFPLTHIQAALPRRYRLRDTAFEIFCFLHEQSYFFNLNVAVVEEEAEEEEMVVPEPATTADSKVTKAVDFTAHIQSILATDKSFHIDEDSDDDVGDEYTLMVDHAQEEDMLAELQPKAQSKEIVLLLKALECTRVQREHAVRMINKLSQQNLPDSTPEQQRKAALDELTDNWVKGLISNHTYLMGLNRESGRSVNDLGQYPIFPWVLTDYTSDTIDLKNPLVYRDLSKPIGALNPDLVSYYTERFEGFEDDVIPPFHYGSHYSNCAIALWYKLRQPGFLNLNKEFQDGHYDLPDRLFDSIQGAWNLCLTNVTDVKELTPEFFGEDESFLVNSTHADFGKKQDGKRVDNVKLPPWANDSPIYFLQMQRQALESEYVSANLHKWVDLMFGVKTRGKEAVKAQNVFFHLTYSENVPNVDAVADPELREATMLQVINFGQVPQQLFFHPHPERKVTHTTVTANVAARARSFSNALSLKAKDTAEKTKSSVTAKWRQATAKISFFKRKPRASSVEEDMSYVRS